MKPNAHPIPEGHHTVTPYLIIKGAGGAIDFYKRAFGAKELMRLASPTGTIMHAEIQIGDSYIMITDEHPDMNARGPVSLGGTPVSLHIYVEDADALFNQAKAAGATVLRPVEDQFYGDRCGSLSDPFGHLWHIATHKEDLSPEELGKRAAAACKLA